MSSNFGMKYCLLAWFDEICWQKEVKYFNIFQLQIYFGSKIIEQNKLCAVDWH